MSFTYDVAGTSDTDKVRLLIPDTNREGQHVYENEELTTFINREGGNLGLGAALALETLAASLAMGDKVIKVGDVQANGAALGDFLLKRAQTLRDTVGLGSATDLPFAIAEIAHGVFGPSEVLTNARLRLG